MINYEKDLISIIIPFYNENVYFDRCLQSALKQTYSNTEIIIINDGSKEEYRNLLENLESKYSKIKVYHIKNSGAGFARNVGVKNAKGEYIAFLDADDEWYSFKLEHQLSIIKKYDLNFLHSSYVTEDEDESFQGTFLARKLNYNNLLDSCDVGLSTVVIKKNLIQRYLFSNITSKEDYICWLKIIKETTCLYGDEKIISIYRIRDNSLSGNILKRFKNTFLVYNKYEKFNLIRSLFQTFNLSIHYIVKQYKSKVQNITKVEFQCITEKTKLKFENSFMLVALNLASLSNIRLLYLDLKNVIFWPDGYFSSSFLKSYKKMPGRKVIEKIDLPKNLNKIYLCGKKSNIQKKYLEKKYNREIYFLELPFFKNTKNIKNFKIDIEDNSVVIINISTPKQEIVAKNILYRNQDKKIFIFCMGAAIAMVSGEEKIVPFTIQEKNLEWFWRLQKDTLFRIKRLIKTFILYYYNKITNLFSKITIININ